MQLSSIGTWDVNSLELCLLLSHLTNPHSYYVVCSLLILFSTYLICHPICFVVYTRNILFILYPQVKICVYFMYICIHSLAVCRDRYSWRCFGSLGGGGDANHRSASTPSPFPPFLSFLIIPLPLPLLLPILLPFHRHSHSSPPSLSVIPPLL